MLHISTCPRSGGFQLELRESWSACQTKQRNKSLTV
jgi:hypothetical protein